MSASHIDSYRDISDHNLFGRECRARSACTYVQSDLDLHSPVVLRHQFVVKIKIGMYITSAHETTNHVVQPFPKQALAFTCLRYKSFENTVGKGEIARYERFLLFPQCFSTLFENFLPFSPNLKLSSTKCFS